MSEDYISRQAAIKAYCESECGKGMNPENCGAEDCGTIFDDIPTVDIVRCKDCKWADRDTIFNGLYCFGEEVTEDWFCADGEKKDG